MVQVMTCILFLELSRHHLTVGKEEHLDNGAIINNVLPSTQVFQVAIVNNVLPNNLK